MITETVENIDQRNIVIMSAVKNNVIDDGLFHKLLYSNKHFIMNGIYIYTNNITDKLETIENYILSKIPNTEMKEYSYKINEFVKKISYPTLIKMSGVWENNTTIGVSYKIYPINKIYKFTK